MKSRTFILLAAALIISAVANAASNMSQINYLEYKCLVGIELTHYVFQRDKRGTAWLIHVIDDNPDASPRKKASKELIRSLESLIEEGDVFSYAPEYLPAEAVCGGAKWELEVRLKNGQSVRSSGRAAEPPMSILESLGLLLRSYLF